MQGCRRSEPIPADVGRETGSTLDWFPVRRSSVTGQLEEARVGRGNRHGVTVLNTAPASSFEFSDNYELDMKL